jgi:sugar phosphate isomerase/epimerase
MRTKTKGRGAGPITRRRFFSTAASITGLAVIPFRMLTGKGYGHSVTGQRDHACCKQDQSVAIKNPAGEGSDHSVVGLSDHACSDRRHGDPVHRYRIAVCDWMILKRQDPGAFRLAGEIGVDGVEVDMGSLGQRPTFENKLLDPAERKKFLTEARKFNLEICSIAMSGFYAQSFPERETVPLMIRDCINTMVLMGVQTAFLPLGVQGDLVKHPGLRPAVIDRLKMAGKMAEAAGVTIGIETALPASGEAELIREVDSPAIRSYLNFANALQNGRDLISEIRTLGREGICQIHCTDEDGQLLENNTRLDMHQVKQALDAINWSGWLVLERSRDAGNPHDVPGNFGANAGYLRSIFK